MQPFAVQPKQNNGDQSESVSSCFNPELVDAEDDQLFVFECPRTGLCLVGVCRTHGRFLLFEFDSNRDSFVVHKCPCQTQVYETDLYPKLCARDPKSNDDVIFARNLVTCKIEQYVFNPNTCDFKQVFKPDLFYDPNLKTVETILVSDIHGDGLEKVAIQIGHDGSLVKAENRFGRTVPIAQFLVKTVMNVDDGEPSDDKVGMDNKENSEVLTLIPKFKIFNSAFSVVHAFSTKSYEYKSYRFNYLTGDFYTVSLPNCPNPNRLCESQIQPKYAVYCDALKTFVLHAYNMENSYPEKFAFDKKKLGFFQVDEPELVYDPQNANTGSLVLFAHESLVVMED